ncbi:hypothetical protein OH77DRAFT_1422261 [Trametes cingulata]|nr:hypothetical protein OH77DRAFT_1422261 [Trametes cingulata]
MVLPAPSPPGPAQSPATTRPLQPPPLLLPGADPFGSSPRGLDPSRARVERAILCGVLDGISLPPVRHGDRVAWHVRVPVEQRLQISLQLVYNCGFKSIGDFLVALFTPHEAPAETVEKKVSAFLRNQTRAGHRPIDVIRLMYCHSASETYDEHGQPARVAFPSLPRHARRRAERCKAVFSETSLANSTRGDVLEWAVSKIILPRVDFERSQLLSHENRLSIHGPVKWETLLAWDTQGIEDIIAREAPVIFATLSSLCVSKGIRKKLQQAAAAGEDEPSNYTDSESEPDPEVNLNIRRDPWLVVTFMVLTALHIAYQFATSFPTIFAIILFVAGTPSRVYRVLGRMGVSIAYSTTIDRLRALAEDSSNRVRSWGSSVKDGQPTFQLLWDNVNKHRKAWQTTLSNQSDMQNGTAATVVKLEDVPEGALRLTPLLESLEKQERLNLTVDVLRKDIDWRHIKGVGTGTLLRIWLKYISALTSHRHDVERMFSETHKKHPLRLRKSEVQSLRCSGIDESTTVGTWQLLMDIIKNQLGITLDWLYDHVVFASGDQLTVHRLRKVKLFRWKHDTPAERAEPFLPLIQLWHMKWNLQKAIFRFGYRPGFTTKGTAGIYHDCTLLGREKFNHKKCDFYDGHHILQDRFEALALEGLRLACAEDTGVSHPPNLPLLDAAAWYFSSDGPLYGCAFKDIETLALTVYSRYMTNRAYDASRYDTTWNQAGSNRQLQSPAVSRSAPHQPQDASTPVDGTPDAASVPDAASSTPAAERKDQTTSADSSWTGDRVLLNNIAFMRLTFWYLEFCAAVAEGDIGRVFEIIKLLRFSFWGAGSTNYGNELLELACNFLYEFPDGLREAILNNYLVNPSGLAGHWHELDLMQEHFNYWLKRLFNTKSLSFDSSFLREVVGLNLRGFCDLRNTMFTFFGLKRTNLKHTEADTRADINRLGSHYREDDVLGFHSGREQPYTVENEFALGMEKLQNGQLQAFLERTTRDCSSVNDDALGGDPENPRPQDSDTQTTNDEHDCVHDDNEEQYPANPIVSGRGGAMTLEAFVAEPELPQ